MRKSALVYTCPPNIKWATDGSRIILVNEEQNDHLILEDDEACLWNWMTIPIPYRKLIRLVARLWSLAPADAEERLMRVLSGWQERGLLTVQVGGDLE